MGARPSKESKRANQRIEFPAKQWNEDPQKSDDENIQHRLF